MSPIVCPPLGDSIPSALPHAISVSLPTWKDTVGYEEGEKRVVDAMKTGYPRFFIHRDIQRLAAIYEAKFGLPNENCLLFPKEYIANAFRDFMNVHRPEEKKTMNVRIVQLLLNDEDTSSSSTKEKEIFLFIALFPSDLFPLAKQFWQHTGLGISSRMAERCLGLLESANTTTTGTTDFSHVRSTSPFRMTFSPRNKRYAANRLSHNNNASIEGGSITNSVRESEDHFTYVEERYGRNMPVSAAVDAKRTLKRRIAGVLAQDDEGSSSENQVLHPSLRGEDVTEDDVYLFPSGMSAIWSAHQLCLSALKPGKSVCFGFPYTDTLKILQKWGPGCHFYGNGTDADLDELETLLKSNPEPQIMALFCEFPSNPLLRCPNLQKMRKLADEYDFVIVVDETIGNFVNVRILPYADIVVSSLTKIFSGDCNVMGGSLILSPSSRHYKELKSRIGQTYQDSYWDEDAIFLERNSRNFIKRILDVNKNAEAVCDFLHSQTSVENSVVKQVYYPKWETRENYDICRLPSRTVNQGNFGGLFSVTFISKEIAEAFFDALPCAKGPSLGTNFTLACPYTILAHFLELPWAAQYGVEEGLIRVSVGLEDTGTLLDWFQTALREAKASTPKKSFRPDT
ncbi:hypothetical protein Clacol_009225 [Clathrus columnatus]|uniref:cystathionine gamma-synthase n=1 Tax=Clathrus columnatus TaxID=1419009 RepID=A0AAV5AKL1_9AGAM|nr:hypothetical protein Clacol_009225 [Clathrus columnatus]